MMSHITSACPVRPIVKAFLCGQAKTNRIRPIRVWTRIFSKTKKQIFVFKNIRTRVDKACMRSTLLFSKTCMTVIT